MFRFIPFILCGVFMVGCVHQTQPETPEKTQLEIREFQTRTFEVNDHTRVMKSVLNVLQDEGFMVKNVDRELGFLSAVKDEGIRGRQEPTFALASDFGVGFSLGRGMGVRSRFPNGRRAQPPRPTHQTIEATVNVSQFGEKVRVRASFQGKVFDNHEAVLRVEQIDDETFYQNFFAKVDKGIFLEHQDI